MLIQIIKFEKLSKFTVDFCGTVILTLERMHYTYNYVYINWKLVVAFLMSHSKAKWKFYTCSYIYIYRHES